MIVLKTFYRVVQNLKLIDFHFILLLYFDAKNQIFHLELRSGIYFLHDVNSEQKRRFMAGVYTEYNRMHLDDIIMINSGPRLLCMVLPRISNDIQWNLKLPTTSKHGEYNLVQSVNIITDRCYG